ncbi:hypothetical protein ABIB85_008263 [Bradyrhizobium sp. JR1.5]
MGFSKISAPGSRHEVAAVGYNFRRLLRWLKAAGIPLGDISYLMHDTTTATNALIERNYPAAAFITTKGFRDTIEIGRQHRKFLYDPYQLKPEPLIIVGASQKSEIAQCSNRVNNCFRYPTSPGALVCRFQRSGYGNPRDFYLRPRRLRADEPIGSRTSGPPSSSSACERWQE